MTDKRLAEYQLTEDEAIRFANENRWECMTPEERGIFQLRQDCLAMPFDKFHEGITKALGRDVYTHEFAKPDLLWDELNGVIQKPDLSAIIARLPSNVTVVILS